MKKVKFIEIKSELCGWGGFKGTKYVFPKINKIIEIMIKKRLGILWICSECY